MSQRASIPQNVAARLSRVERQFSESMDRGSTKSDVKEKELTLSEKQIAQSLASLDDLKVRKCVHHIPVSVYLVNAQ